MGAKGNGNNVWIGLSFSKRNIVLFQLAVFAFSLHREGNKFGCKERPDIGYAY